MIEALVATAQTQIVLHEGANEKSFHDEQERVEHLASKAWSMIYRLTPESLDQAEKLCAAALSLDPDSARAHQALAAVKHHQYYMGFTGEPATVLHLGLSHIDRAVAINEEDEYTHWVRGNVLVCLRDTRRALAAFDRSREINPAFSLAVASYGTACAWAGRREVAIQMSEQALSANPKDPSNFFRFNSISVAHFTAADFEQSLELGRTHARAEKEVPRPASDPAWRPPCTSRRPISQPRWQTFGRPFRRPRALGQEMTPFTRQQDQESMRLGLERALA